MKTLMKHNQHRVIRIIRENTIKAQNARLGISMLTPKEKERESGKPLEATANQGTWQRGVCR